MGRKEVRRGRSDYRALDIWDENSKDYGQHKCVAYGIYAK